MSSVQVSALFDEGSVDESVWRFGGRSLASTVPRSVFEEVVQLRRRLHERPELAFQETFTASTVRERLKAIEGVRVLERASGGTGVIAVIQGGREGGKTILFRADLDGLPIQEKMSGSSSAGGGGDTSSSTSTTSTSTSTSSSSISSSTGSSSRS